MTPSPFDVVVVPFPYSDRLAEKRRPALVVSVSDLPVRLGRVWVAMITSAVHGADFGDAVISDLQTAGLQSASMVRTSKITTIDADRVIRRAGRLSERDKAQASQMLRAFAAF
jgi:mRNA interferase MazF